MRPDPFTQTLHVRVPPSMRDGISAAAEAEDITAGEFIRRAVKAELAGSTGRALDPYADIPHAEREAHFIEALTDMGDPAREAALIAALEAELDDTLEIAVQALGILGEEAAHMRFERVAGHLRQASLAVLKAASRTMAIRTRRSIERGDLEREIVRLEAGER